MQFVRQLDRLRDGLTRRRAWMIIAFLLVWNLTLGGLLVRQALKDHASTAFVAQIVLAPSVFIVVAIVWLLRNSRRSPDEGANP